MQVCAAIILNARRYGWVGLGLAFIGLTSAHISSLGMASLNVASLDVAGGDDAGSGLAGDSEACQHTSDDKQRTQDDFGTPCMKMQQFCQN